MLDFANREDETTDNCGFVFQIFISLFSEPNMAIVFASCSMPERRAWVKLRLIQERESSCFPFHLDVRNLLISICWILQMTYGDFRLDTMEFDDLSVEWSLLFKRRENKAARVVRKVRTGPISHN